MRIAAIVMVLNVSARGARQPRLVACSGVGVLGSHRAAIRDRRVRVERVSTAGLRIPSVSTRPKATTRNVKRH